MSTHSVHIIEEFGGFYVCNFNFFEKATRQIKYDTRNDINYLIYLFKSSVKTYSASSHFDDSDSHAFR